MTDATMPRIEIRRVGWRTYRLDWCPADGSLGLEGPTILGLGRARRRAVRDLRRLDRAFREHTVVAVVTDPGGDPQ